MIHPCDKPCGNKTASGYCATTACINPKYSNIGTALYGQGVQKCIVTNADRIRAMEDIELGNFLSGLILGCSDCPMYEECDGAYCNSRWQKWLKEEAT